MTTHEERTEDAETLDRRFIDFVEDHVKPFTDPTDPTLMAEGVFSLSDPNQLFPFDRVEFAEYRDLEDDPNLVEEVEITFFIGELEIISIAYNIFSFEYSQDFYRGKRTNISDEYRYYPAHIIDTLVRQEADGQLTEIPDSGDTPAGS